MKEKRPGVGVGVMVFNEKNKILLGRRHFDPKKASSELHGGGQWTMPGGKLDWGEKLTQGAIRETKEECGLELSGLKIISITDNILSDAHFVTIGFMTKNFKGVPKVMEPDEITEWQWFDLDKLPQPMYFPSEGIIKSYLSGKIYPPTR